MSIWDKVTEAREEERFHAALGVQDLQCGREDAARDFFELAARHRAVGHEFRATGKILEELQAERLAELRRRVEVLSRPVSITN